MAESNLTFKAGTAIMYQALNADGKITGYFFKRPFATDGPLWTVVKLGKDVAVFPALGIEDAKLCLEYGFSLGD